MSEWCECRPGELDDAYQTIFQLEDEVGELKAERDSLRLALHELLEYSPRSSAVMN